MKNLKTKKEAWQLQRDTYIELTKPKPMKNSLGPPWNINANHAKQNYLKAEKMVNKCAKRYSTNNSEHNRKLLFRCVEIRDKNNILYHKVKKI